MKLRQVNRHALYPVTPVRAGQAIARKVRKHRLHLSIPVFLSASTVCFFIRLMSFFFMSSYSLAYTTSCLIYISFSLSPRGDSYPRSSLLSSMWKTVSFSIMWCILVSSPRCWQGLSSGSCSPPCRYCRGMFCKRGAAWARAITLHMRLTVGSPFHHTHSIAMRMVSIIETPNQRTSS